MKVWKDFSILIAGFTSSHHIPISFHELRYLPKTNMKSEDSGNVTGFRPRKIPGLKVLYRVYICFYLFISGKHHDRDNLQSSFSKCFVIFSFFINYSDKENGRRSGRNVYLVKIGPKSLGDGRQDICKDKECNLGAVAGY